MIKHRYEEPYIYQKEDYICGINEKYLKYFKEDLILDYGCGFGDITIKLLKKGYHIVACDINESIIDKFKDKIKNTYINKINIVLIEKEKELPFEDNKFGCVICTEVLEHMQDVDYILKEFKRVVSKGGVIIISTPNPISEYIYRIFDSKYMEQADHKKILGKKYLLYAFGKHKMKLINVEKHLFYWSFNWIFMSLFRTRHYMGRIQSNWSIYRLLCGFWHKLALVGLKRHFEIAGDTLFPKSHFYYLKNMK